MRSSETPLPRGLTVVVPLFNEAEGAPALVAALRDFAEVEGARRPVECVLVDDGSTDATVATLRREVADNAAIRILQHDSNLGLTAALRTGSEAAAMPLVGWLDADLTYDPSLLTTLAAQVDDGADVAIASCYHPEGDVVGVPKWRLALSRLASRLHGAAVRARIHTYTCMVRVQPHELLQTTWPERGGFLGVTEQLLRTLERGARVAETPAVLRTRTTGQSKMRVLRVGLGHLGLAWAAATGGLR